MKSRIAGLIIAVFLVFSLLPNAVLASFSDRDTVIVLIDMKDSSAFRPNELKEFAGRSQKPVIDLIERNKGTVLNKFWLNNSILVKVSYEAILELRFSQEIEAIYANFEVRIPPKDASALAGEQRPWGIDRIGAPDVWAKGIKGSGVRIAVLDTGVDITHPDLAGKMWTDNLSDPTYPGGWIEFDDYGNVVKNSVPHDTNGHGTHTSGTALGGSLGGKEIGVAPEATLMHALILPEGSGSFSQVIAGMQWAIEPFDQNGNPAGQSADIVSMSWGSTGYADFIMQIIKKIREAGAIPVAAIGNNGEGNSGSPGNARQTFGVGATDQYDMVAWWSGGELVNWPESYPWRPYIKPDFSAPGVAVLSAVPGGNYESWSGTSMAAPHVAGAAALILNSKPELTAEQIYQILAATSLDKGDAGQDTRYGFGIINANKAVSAVYSGVDGFITSQTAYPLQAAISVKDNGGKTIFSTLAGADGYYQIYLLPGTYKIIVDEFWHQNQEAAIEVQENAFVKQDFSLTLKVTGAVRGKVKDKNSGSPISGAEVILENTPLAAGTDSGGEYSVVLPVGTYNIKVYAGNYLPSPRQTIELKEDVESEMDFDLEPFLAAIMGDWNDQISKFLSQNGFSAEMENWDIVQNIADYNVVVLNLPTDPGKETFLNFINAAQQNKVGLIFTSSFPGSDWSYGISLLQKYLENPKGQSHGYGKGRVSYNAVFPHPIFKGIDMESGDIIAIIDKGDMDFAYFQNYAGVKAAGVSVGNLQPADASGAAFDLSHGNAQLLLASLAAQPWTGVGRWTDQGKTLFLNSVKWAGMKPAEIALDKREAAVGETVSLTGIGLGRQEIVRIYRENLLIAETVADDSGAFSAAITVPEVSAGTYNLVVLGGGGKMGMAKLKIKPIFLAETNSGILSPGSEMKVSGKGFNSKSEVKLYYNGSLFQVMATDESGSFSDIIEIPFATFPGLQQMMGIDEKGNFSSTSFAIANEWTESLSSSVLEIKNNVAQLQASLNQGIAAVTTDTSSIKNSLNNLDAKITGVEKGVALVQTELGTVKVNLKDLDAKVTGVSEGVALVQTELGTVKVNLKDLDAKVTGVSEGVALVQTELGIVKVNLKDLDAKVTGVSEGVALVQTELGIVKAGLKDLGAKVVAVEDNTVSIQTSLGVVQTSLDAINAQVVKIDKGVATIETDVGVLEGKVVKIQNSVSEGVAAIQTDIGTVQLQIKDADIRTSSRLDELQSRIGRDFYILLGSLVLLFLAAGGATAVIHFKKR